jgi:hypothetical protein
VLPASWAVDAVAVAAGAVAAVVAEVLVVEVAVAAGELSVVPAVLVADGAPLRLTELVLLMLMA